MPPCLHEARTENHSGGKQGLLSSGRKFAKAGFAAGFAFWPRRRTIIAAMAASVLLPIEVSDASWLSDLLQNSPKHGKSPTHATSRKPVALAKRTASPKPRAAKLAAPGLAVLKPSASKPVAAKCD